MIATVTVIAAAITAKISKAKLPTHVEVNKDALGLVRDSVILLEQVTTIDKKRLRQRLGKLESETMEKVDVALLISLGLAEETND